MSTTAAGRPGNTADPHPEDFDVAPAPVGRTDAPPPGPTELEQAGAVAVFRRGLAVTPELKVGLAFTAAMAAATAAGKLAVPVLIQQILDRGITGPAGFRPAFVYGAGAVAVAAIAGVTVAGRATYLRLVRAAEQALYRLRVRVFAHVHELSVATHNETRRGELVSRVTSDIETLARFAQWGGVAWIVDSVLILGTVAVMLVYSWQLTAVVVGIFVPLVPVMRILQRKQLARYDVLRTRVGETLAEISEAVTGAAVVRAYGLERRSRARLHAAIDRQYVAQIGAAKYFALMFPLGDLFGALSIAAVAAVGSWYGPGWGLGLGEVVAFVFLVNLLMNPIAELSEILEQTQTAIAGWRKVLAVLGMSVDVVEPEPGTELPRHQPLSVRTEGLCFAYRDGDAVLHDVDIDLPAGTHVAVVGETGSGKTTFVKLLCRLADPTAGRVLLAGVDLRSVARASRLAAVRMVPQDGFLFDTSVVANVRYGRPGATDQDALDAFEALGLGRWLVRLPDGLDTRVGERGDRLSVGERQLVALARAQLSDPGLLILDEATSAVDPDTEQVLAGALARLSRGRTTVTVAHRLSTAEKADLVLVFDAGRLVEQGTHDELVARRGVYARLHESWLGGTRERGAA